MLRNSNEVHEIRILLYVNHVRILYNRVYVPCLLVQASLPGVIDRMCGSSLRRRGVKMLFVPFVRVTLFTSNLRDHLQRSHSAV